MARRFLTFFVLLLNTALLLSQQLTEEELMGKWLVREVQVFNNNPNHKEGVEFLKQGYTGAIFHFKGNGIFQMTYSENANPLIEEFNASGENWEINGPFVDIGMEEEKFTSMRILPEAADGNTYFTLPMMRLEVIKIKSEKAKKRKKGKSKSKRTLDEQYANTKPVELITRNLDDELIVPFPETDTPPLLLACSSIVDPEEAKKCVSRTVQKHVQRKFNTGLAVELGLEGKIRIDVAFVIDTTGQVINITSTGAHDALNKSATQAIGSLPVFIAGLKDGEPVNVSYKLPILFQVAR
ncbi:MAG: energy transducer TonB [Bacteroidota bacterium]